MNIEQLYEFCIQKKGVSEHFPFDQDTLVFKVGGKMFALASLHEWEKNQPAISLKCNPEKAQLLRNTYSEVSPGYHLSKIHWNTVLVNQSLSDDFIFDLISHSYELVFSSLTKKNQVEIIQCH